MQTSEQLLSPLGPSQQLDGVDLESGRQLLEDVDAGGILFAFDQADIVAVDAGKVGERLLSEPAILPEPPQVLREGPPESHAVDRTAWAKQAPPSILAVFWIDVARCFPRD